MSALTADLEDRVRGLVIQTHHLLPGHPLNSRWDQWTPIGAA